MRYRKTPTNQRTTYRHIDETGRVIAEYKPGVDGVTAVDIKNMHRLDDHEVYENVKQIKHPEWYEPIYESWKNSFIKHFEEQNGRKPHPTEIPGKYTVFVSLEAAADEFGEYTDKCRLQAAIAVCDKDDETDGILRLRELVSEMPERWQIIYHLAMIEKIPKVRVGKILDISDVRVGQIVKKIENKIRNDCVLKSIYL